MSRKRKYPMRWCKKWFIVEVYHPIGWLRRTKFIVKATTHRTAVKKLQKLYPGAQVFCVSPI